MNQLTLTNSEITMSSREIAELTGKRHDHVLRDISTMLVDLGVTHPSFGGSYKDSTGRTRVMFNLPYRETTILLTGYSVPMRAKVVDRWTELEAKALAPAPQRNADDFLNDPAAMRGLLLGYTEKVMALQGKVETMQSTVDAHERIAVADGSSCITDTAKTLQMRPKDLFSWLQAHDWIYRRAGGSGWIAYQHRIQQGVLEHKVTTVERSDGTEKVVEQVLVTRKGLARLAEQVAVVA